MKGNLIILTLFGLITSACSSSFQVSGGKVDDLYYWPGDNPPVYASEELPDIGTGTKTVDNDMLIISEVGKNENGANTLNNYIYADDEPDWYSDLQSRNAENINRMDQDTLIYQSDEEGTYIVNNYYLDDDDYYYSNRLRLFHDPYYYDPYWNFTYNWGWGSYYSPFRSYNSWYWDPWYNSWGWGYDPWYYSGGWGYNPWHYNSWYGHGYYGWNYPYYNHHNQYGYNNYNWRSDNKNYNESSRRSRNPIATYGGTSNIATTSRIGENEYVGESTNKSTAPQSRRTVINETDRVTTSQKSASTDLRSQSNQGRVLTEKRRSSLNSNSAERPDNRSNVSTNRSHGTNSTPSYRAPSSSERRLTGNTNESVKSSSGRSSYTPSYNKPRTNTRATYNSNRTNNDDSRISRPSESRSTYRAPSERNSTYNKSSQSSSKSSYQIPSSSSRSKSYGNSGSSGSSYKSNSTQSSSPSRSYSSGSSSPSRSYSSGSSSGSSVRSSGGSSSGGSSHSSSGGSSSSGSSHSSSPSRR